MSVVASAARVNFTGAVTLAVTGAPTGVTINITQPEGSGVVVTGHVAITASAATAPGTYSLTISASGTGVATASASFQLVVTAVGNYTIAVGTAALAVSPGASGLSLIGLTRNNFTAPITLAVDNLPAGVTASFTPNPVSFSNSALTVDVGATVPPGVYNLVVRGSSAGFPNVTAPLVLTVASLGGFTLSATPINVTMQQGTSTPVTINVARNGGFTGLVTLAVEGAPAGLTVTPTLTATNTNSANFTLTASAALAVGSYNLLFRGSAPGLLDVIVQLPVAITSAPTGNGNVTLDFSACVGLNRPSWVAYQDGSGPWTRATSNNQVFQFPIASSKGGFAYAIPGPTTNTAGLQVQYMSRAEMSAAPIVFCAAPTLSLKLLSGTVTGMNGGDAVNVSIGGGIGFANANLPSLSIGNVQNGPQDLVAWRNDAIADILGAPNTDRGFVRRDVDLPSGASLGTLDMNGAESFAPATATFNLAGTVAGEELAYNLRYMTGAACQSGMLYGGVVMLTPTSFSARGFPASRQRASDYHQVIVSTTTRQGGLLYPIAQRSVAESFHSMAPRSLTLAAAIQQPTVTTLPGSYKRLQAVFGFAADYNGVISLSYTTGAQSKTATITATPAWIGGNTATLSLPDFDGVAGWNSVWAPASSATGVWTAMATGSTLVGPTLCSENARVVSSLRQGGY